MLHNGFACLSYKTYRKIRKLNRDKNISIEFYQELEDIKEVKKLEQVLRNNIKVDEETAKKINWYITTKVLKWDRDDHRKRITLNGIQLEFIKELLLQGGFYSRDKCLKEKFTEYMINYVIYDLEDLDIILIIKTKKKFKHKIFFIIHPGILKEVS